MKLTMNLMPATAAMVASSAILTTTASSQELPLAAGARSDMTGIAISEGRVFAGTKYLAAAWATRTRTEMQQAYGNITEFCTACRSVMLQEWNKT